MDTQNEQEDAYLILGVGADATTAQIRLAYRQGAQRWHPDRAGPAGHLKFIALQRAYQTLSTPSERSAHDEEILRRAKSANQARDPAEADAEFSQTNQTFDIRARWDAWRHRSRPAALAPRGDHASVRVKVPLAELLSGTRRRIYPKIAIICPRCAGRLPRCPLCAGTGQRLVVKEYVVSIPAGAVHGAVLALRGAGHEGPMFSAPGDVLVQVWWTKTYGWESRGGEWWKIVRIRQSLDLAGSVAIRGPDGRSGLIRWAPLLDAGYRRVLRVPGIGWATPDGNRAPLWVELRKV
jgi:DnaJ-class molecular chaperone